jgi:hypothetical protein
LINTGHYYGSLGINAAVPALGRVHQQDTHGTSDAGQPCGPAQNGVSQLHGSVAQIWSGWAAIAGFGSAD